MLPLQTLQWFGLRMKKDGLRESLLKEGMEGFTTPETHGKWSLRASATGELVFDNVKVPKENLLPNKDGLGAPLGCLDSARYGIAWGTIGAAMDCYDTALRYSKERIQFGRPIAGFQLQQKKLAEMITEITKAQFITWRLEFYVMKVGLPLHKFQCAKETMLIWL